MQNLDQGLRFLGLENEYLENAKEAPCAKFNISMWPFSLPRKRFLDVTNAGER